MTNLILVLILVCLVRLLRIEYKKLPKKPKETFRSKPKPLTEEQQREERRILKETENFWGYDGTEQDKIEA